MDDARFDALTQRLGSATTRRATVWGALAGAAGLLGLLDPPGSLSGKRKRKKKKCKGGFKRKCGKRCVDLATSAANCGACGTTCASGGCINGVCTCGTAACACECLERLGGEGVCVQPATAQSCDSDAECGLGKACLAGGKCASACPSV